MNLNHLVEVVFVRLLHCEVSLPHLPLSILCSLRWSLYMQPTLKEWGAMYSTSVRADYLQKLLVILHGRLVSFPPFIYSVSHLFTSVWVFFLLCPSTYPHYCGVFCLFLLKHFLVLEGAPGSSWLFLAPGLDSTISPRRLGSFNRRMVLETKIQVLGMLLATEVSLLLGPSADRVSKYTYE